jgi:hypothetical protein
VTDLNPFSPPQPVRTPLPTSEALPIAAGVGVPVLAVLSHTLSLSSVGAGLAIGALVAGGIVILLRNTRPTVTSCLGGGGIIGAVAGVAWWTLLDPARTLAECALLGALGGAALLAVELYRRARASDS